MKLQEVRIEDVFPDPKNPREDFGDVTALAESFGESGQPFVPIIVLRDGGIFRIVDGERRYRAMKKLGTKKCWANVCEDLDDANVVMAMLATDDKKALSDIEASRGVQQALVLGVDPIKVEKASKRRNLQKAKRALYEVTDAAEDMSIDRLVAIDEMAGHPEAVKELTNCKEAEWRRVFDRWKRVIGYENEAAAMQLVLDEFGIQEVDEAPDGLRHKAALTNADSLRDYVESKMGDGLERAAVRVLVEVLPYGVFARIYAPTDEKVDKEAEERRARVREMERQLTLHDDRVMKWYGKNMGEPHVYTLALKTALDYAENEIDRQAKLFGPVFFKPRKLEDVAELFFFARSTHNCTSFANSIVNRFYNMNDEYLEEWLTRFDACVAGGYDAEAWEQELAETIRDYVEEGKDE